jgi:heterodisulfide reductase subunit A
MDLRMWGQHFEELYREAQTDYNIKFIRGRISEAGGTFDRRVQIKAEDTLMGRPMKLTVDLFVLMVGMEASQGTRSLAAQAGIAGEYGFAQACDPHTSDNCTAHDGLFVAGSCKRPMTLTDTLADARSAAWEVLRYLHSGLK